MNEVIYSAQHGDERCKVQNFGRVGHNAFVPTDGLTFLARLDTLVNSLVKI